MKQAVITGGCGGLGQAVARALEHPEWEVLAPGRDELDVRDENAVTRYFQTRAPELLVCAAGVIRDASLARTSEADWDEVLAVNFHGASICATAALPRMVEAGSGHVIFISSFSALHPPLGQAAYAAAKASLLGLTEDLAARHGSSNIRVNAVLPGFLETRMTSSVSARRCETVLSEHSLQRFNTLEAVAKFIRHLHHELPHTSGQFFQLDSRRR